MSEGFLPEPHPSEPKAGSPATPALRRVAVPTRYRFGLYEADPRSGELLREGRKIKLQEQPFQVLLALLERPNEIVTREELRLRLWPSDTFVDFDHGLNTAINKLRDALRDSASNPRFIETLARRGYRFVAPVGAVDLAGAVEPVPAAAQAPASVGESALPQAHRGTVRTLFALSQILYLSMYIAALAHLHQADGIAERLFAVNGTWVVVAVIVTCAIGIPLRLYLLTAIAFDYAGLGENYRRLFAVEFPLDEIWALAPFLLVPNIGFGLAFAAMATLVYLPFSQRTLVRMAYSAPQK
jgi:DNA-binding winged helix-turn-helix (wHTH) protein